MPKPPPENSILYKKKQSQGQKWLTVNRKWNFWDQWYAETCLVWINALLCITVEYQIILVICITFIREMWINSRPLIFVNNRGSKLFLHAKKSNLFRASLRKLDDSLGDACNDPGTLYCTWNTGTFPRTLLIPGLVWSWDYWF